MKITGAELFVKALKEEKVDTLFAYPGGQAIDLFDALYGQDMSRDWFTPPTGMPVPQAKSACVLSRAVRALPIS